LLTSSAWSAVIHRPADEDSEPDNLPSTVDMDAIKVTSMFNGQLFNLHVLDNALACWLKIVTLVTFYLKYAWFR
jgi:hypothetical protein